MLKVSQSTALLQWSVQFAVRLRIVHILEIASSESVAVLRRPVVIVIVAAVAVHAIVATV